MNDPSRRRFLKSFVAAGVFTSSIAGGRSLKASDANSEISLGYIGCGGRANKLMESFNKIEGVNVTALCDPDAERLGATKDLYPKAQGFSDMRDLLKGDLVDAVVISTCNHWHCLAAIWAMEAGKDVYVEKPLSHSQWEGEQTVAAARKYDRICQVGTQQRSDPMQAEIKKFLHEEKALGEIKSARVNRYGVRKTIGKRTAPLRPPESVKYDLWLGPAADTEIMRQKFHYDWHWNYNTGSGEMGNWGVHVLDDVRNNIFLDRVALPEKVIGGGGRVVWNDAGDTPNVHFAYFETGSIPVVIGLSNLTNSKSSTKATKHPGPHSGYIAYCEGGRLEGKRGGAKAFDSKNKVIKTFKGNGGLAAHTQNFIDAVRAQDSSMLNADIQIGHDSTGWCNLANTTYQTGKPFMHTDAAEIDVDVWGSLIGDMESLLERHEIDIQSEAIKLSPVLEIDPKTQRFVGPHADAANRFMKREYREGFELPEIQMATSE